MTVYICSKCAAVYVNALLSQLLASVLNGVQNSVTYCERMALIGATVLLNQQGKSSGYGRSSGSQKHTSTYVSVHGTGPSCQVFHILVSCYLFVTLL